VRFFPLFYRSENLQCNFISFNIFFLFFHESAIISVYCKDTSSYCRYYNSKGESYVLLFSFSGKYAVPIVKSQIRKFMI
jgi:hypothetical protein